jgi:hypothetical protein
LIFISVEIVIHCDQPNISISIYLSFISILEYIYLHLYHLIKLHLYQLYSISIEMVIHCDHPNSAIHQFNGSLMIGDEQLSLDESSLLLRGNTCTWINRYEYVYLYMYLFVYLYVWKFISISLSSLEIGDKQLSLDEFSLLLRGNTCKYMCM